MRLKFIRHEGVELGSELGGATRGMSVEITPLVRFSRGGCNLPGCTCSPNGPWLLALSGRSEDGVILGTLVEFDDGAELAKVLGGGDFAVTVVELPELPKNRGYCPIDNYPVGDANSPDPCKFCPRCGAANPWLSPGEARE